MVGAMFRWWVGRWWQYRCRGGLLALGLLSVCGTAWSASPDRSSTFPRGPVTLLVPYQPGGATDVIARALATGLSKELQVPVLVETRPGGGGEICLAALARAKADGQVLGMGTV